MSEIRGILEDVIFHNPENGYTIGELATEEDLVTVVGILPAPAAGTTYVLRGEETVHPKYGEQFSFTSASPVMPVKEEEILELLSSGIFSGLGAKTARLIVERFGEDTLRIMGEEPERLQEVSGIGKKTGAKIAAAFQKHQAYVETALFFEKVGVPPRQAVRLYQTYGQETVQAVKEDPYRLAEDVRGFGFRRADEIAQKLGIPQDSPLRIQSGILYGLRTGIGNGSTCLPMERFLEETAQFLDLTREQVFEVLGEMAFQSEVKVDRVAGEEVVYLYSYFEAEQRVAKDLLALLLAEKKEVSGDVDYGIRLSESSTGKELSQTQKEAVRGALAEGVSVITGGPGTGKTTIIDALITVFKTSGLSFRLAAPTGRAAKRMSQATGQPAQTVHRMLEYHFEDGTGKMVFGKTAEDPLKTDAVIVDEASMIDLMMMRGLLDAIRPGTRLILVGDADQLPSVGAGDVLHDIIGSGLVKTFRLTEIFRQAEESRIVTNAHRINRGEDLELNGKDSDFFFLECRSDRKLQDLMKDLAVRRLPGFYQDIDPLRDLQVITPVHKGPVGTDQLNQVLQAACNPPIQGKPERTFGDQTFRLGDKVMQIRNDYQMEWRRPGDEKAHQGVFNGDLGFVSAVDNERGVLTVTYDGDRYAEYDGTTLEELSLAYAITVHKSQGSEFPILLMPITYFPPMLATRNLLYTAVTRGKRVVVLAGSYGMLQQMIGNDRTSERTTGLRERLGAMVPYKDPESPGN